MNRAMCLIVAVIIGVLSVGLVTTAAAGAGGPGASAVAAKKKKKKTCPAGTTKKVKKKKNGKKRVSCVPNPVVPAPVATPPAGTATLAISPPSFGFGGTQHNCMPAVCPTQAFTITNTGTASSGALSAVINEVQQPVMGAHSPGFDFSANTCTAALAPGASCTATVRFRAPSNAGDQTYVSNLVVSGSPGGSVQATVSGTGL